MRGRTFSGVAALALALCGCAGGDYVPATVYGPPLGLGGSFALVTLTVTLVLAESGTPPLSGAPPSR